MPLPRPYLHTCISYRLQTSSSHRHKKRAPKSMWSFYDLLARQRGCCSLPSEASAGRHRPHLLTSLHRARARLFVVSASIFLPLRAWMPLESFRKVSSLIFHVLHLSYLQLGQVSQTLCQIIYIFHSI